MGWLWGGSTTDVMMEACNSSSVRHSHLSPPAFAQLLRKLLHRSF